jgi:hypothetical protein
MRKIRYALFPLALRLIGMAFILIALYNVYTLTTGYRDPQYIQKVVGISLGFFLIGFILNTTCSVLKFDTTKMLIRKRMYIFGIKLSDEVVRVPKDCNELIIRQKNKENTGYLGLVVPVNYTLKAGDLFFRRDKNLVRLMNTDPKRAVKIAEIIKEEFHLDYKII